MLKYFSIPITSYDYIDCAGHDFFQMAVTQMVEKIKENVPNRLNTTADFQFISCMYD